MNDSPHRVSPKTRARVLAAVRRLDYHPSDIARSLKKQVSHALALVLPNITNPFYPEIAAGIEDVARAHGYTVILCNTFEDPKKEQSYYSLLRRRWVDGVIVVPVGDGARSLRMIRQYGLACVSLARSAAGGRIDSVLVDNVKGMYAVTSHLLEHGHRRLAFIAGPEDLSIVRDRLAGFQAALKAFGVPFRPSMVAPGDFLIESGRRAAAHLLRLDPRPTAIAAANDLMAIGAMREVEAAGLRVPADISIVGFDDIPYAEIVKPPLTTVAQPKYAMGKAAAERLLELLHHPQRQPKQIVLEPRLVVRGSTAPPRGARNSWGRRKGQR